MYNSPWLQRLQQGLSSLTKHKLLPTSTPTHGQKELGPLPLQYQYVSVGIVGTVKVNTIHVPKELLRAGRAR